MKYLIPASKLITIFLIGIHAASVLAADKLTYDVRLGSIQIRDTRSRGDDTLYASITVSVNGKSKGTATWDGTGGRQKNNGFYPLFNAGGAAARDFIKVSTGPISDTDVVTVSFALLNTGKDPHTADYNSAADNLTKTACQSSADSPDNSGWVCILAEVGKAVVGWALTDCDGLLAADTFKITGSDLREKSEQGPGLPLEGLKSFGLSRDYYGTQSPSGCGHNSNFRVDLFIVRPNH